MKISEEAREITLAVLSMPELHYKSCYEDASGRPIELECNCPMKYAINKVALQPR